MNVTLVVGSVNFDSFVRFYKTDYPSCFNTLHSVMAIKYWAENFKRASYFPLSAQFNATYVYVRV